MKNIFSILLVFYLFVLNGQQEVVYAPYYSFDIYSTQNGLSNNRINTIIQDNEGYFWIGTENGLNKFDGYEFTQYFSDAQDSLSISGNIICAISIDNKGNVWVGSDGGLDIYDNIINGFNHVYPFSGDSIAKTAKFVRAIYCENDSILWFDTADGKLHKYHQQNHSEQAFQHKIPSQIHTYYYHQLFDDGEGNIWIGGRGMDPCKFNKKTKIFTYYKANPDDDTRKRDRDVTKYYIDKKGVFWVAGVDGLYVFNKETEVFLKYLNGSTFDLIDFDKDELWISNGKGIKILKRTNKKLYSITHNEENKKSLPSNYVFDFYKDNAGNLWIGTLEGLCKYSPYKNKFQTAFHVFSDDKTLSSDNITSILQTEGGEIWVGTKNNGIDILNEDFLKTDHYDISENSKYRLASNRVSKLFQDKNGNIYIGLWAGVGFDFIESKTSELYHFSLNSESQKLDWYNDFCDDTNGDVLIGTWGSYSVAKFDPREKKFVDKPLKPAPFINKLGSHFVNCLLQNSNGDLFVGTSNKGLSIYNQNSGNFKNFSGLETDSTKLWGQNIRCIFKDTKDNIWIGAKGLNKYNSIDESIEHFTKKNGLCDDGVQAILEDEDGNLWISTLNGLSKFNPETAELQNYYKKDGLRGNEFTNAAYKLEDGRLVFGSKNGLVIINTDIVPIDKHKPVALITGFKIFAEPQELNKIRKGTIKLRHNRNYLSFVLSSNDYSSIEDNKFAYKLENFDNDWHYTNPGQREAIYTYLEPGEYQLKVKTANLDEIWGEETAKLDIVITPPWWKTWWFILFEIFVLLSIVYIVIKFRESKLKEQYFVELLEQRLLRSQMNPHFIFNALGAIQSYIFTHNPIEAGTYLSKFADLMRSILYGSKEEFVSLEKEIETIKNYLFIQQLRFEDKFDFRIEISPDINTEFIGAPPLLIQPFLENSIEHGFKELDIKGELIVRIGIVENKLRIVVEDNGKGIEDIDYKNTSIKDVKSGKKHQSMALHIIRKRLRILNKEKSGKYDLKIDNIKNNNDEILGVRVTFFVPLIYLNQ